MAFRTLDDLDVRGKRVLVRADLNVPVADGHVTDATRITRQAPTIRELAEKGAKVIILSHFDRPKGKVVPSMSLKVLVEPLARSLALAPVEDEEIAPHTVAAVDRARASLKRGEGISHEDVLREFGLQR